MRFVDVKCSRVYHLAFQACDSSLALGFVRHFHETEASGLSAVSVFDDVNRLNFAKDLKLATQIVLGNIRRQITDVDLHDSPPFLIPNNEFIIPGSLRWWFSGSEQAEARTSSQPPTR
jgi:hypothetical protein